MHRWSGNEIMFSATPPAHLACQACQSPPEPGPPALSTTLINIALCTPGPDSIIFTAEMTTCQHVAWVQLISGRAERRIIDTNILHRIADSLTGSHEHFPRITLLIGNTIKDDALKYLCKFNNFGRQKRSKDNGGVLKIRCETSSSRSRYPSYFADVDPYQFASSLEYGRSHCHQDTNICIQWSRAAHRLEDLVIARLVIPFLDALCFFADDCGGQSPVTELLKTWGHLAEDAPPFSPREVIVVVDSATQYDEQAYVQIQSSFPTVYKQIRVVKLQAPSLSPVSRYLRLDALLLRTLDLSTTQRIEQSMMFSAQHQASFFTLAVEHFAAQQTERFDFVAASRGQETRAGLEHQLSRSMSVLLQAGLSIEAMAELHASCVTMNAYPQGTHSE